MGFIEKIIPLRHEAEGSVSSLPALMTKAEKIASSTLHGPHAQRKSGSGEKFWQFREYDSSDRPQDIDWRQSAKTDSIYIKQKEWQTTQKSYIWCAGGHSMNFTSDPKYPTKQYAAQIIALALALLLQRSEEQIGFYGDLKTGRSEKKLEQLGHYLLSRHGNNEPLPLPSLFTLPKHASFIGIGDFLSPLPEIQSSLSQAASVAENGLIVQILDPAEISLNYTGRIKFKGPYNQTTELINNVSSVREQYKDRIKAHIESFQKFCFQHNWSYVLHVTDASPTDTMKNIFSVMDIGGHT